MDSDTALGILDDLDNLERSLPPKDVNFVDSLLKQLEADPTHEPSEKQAKWLLDLKARYLD